MKEFSLVMLNTESKCLFCGCKENNHLKYGNLYRLKGVVAHYYCVLLSHKIRQRGKDDEGILGFLLDDIKEELQNRTKVKCFYCRKGTATLKCNFSKCRKNFHLPCALKNDSLHQFTKQYKSFCSNHKPNQDIPKHILQEAKTNLVVCPICYNNVDITNLTETLWAPCCKKTWYHKICVQELAYNAGYFFKCAICNNVNKFKNWMLKFGIYVPDRDASWEREPNAFEDLLFRYSRCDAVECKCPEGREKDLEDTMWEIILCQSCGSQGMHIGCGKLKFMGPEWECPTCKLVTTNINSSAKSHVTSKENFIQEIGESSNNSTNSSEARGRKRKRTTEESERVVLHTKKKGKSTSACDTDEIIDVETVEPETPNLENDVHEVLSRLKPGPLSYKLAQLDKEKIRGEFGNSSKRQTVEREKKGDAAEISSESDLEIIELDDSTDEESSRDDIEIISENIEKDDRQVLTSWDKVRKEMMDLSDDESLEIIESDTESESFSTAKTTVTKSREQTPSTDSSSVTSKVSDCAISDWIDSENPSVPVVSKIEDLSSSGLSIKDFEIIGTLNPVAPSHYLVQMVEDWKSLIRVPDESSEILVPLEDNQPFVGSSKIPTGLKEIPTQPTSTVKLQCSIQEVSRIEENFKKSKADSEEDVIIIEGDNENINKIAEIEIVEVDSSRRKKITPNCSFK